MSWSGSYSNEHPNVSPFCQEGSIITFSADLARGTLSVDINGEQFPDILRRPIGHIDSWYPTLFTGNSVVELLNPDTDIHSTIVHRKHYRGLPNVDCADCAAELRRSGSCVSRQ